MTKAPLITDRAIQSTMDGLAYIQMMRNNVSEGLSASELYNNNLCLLCEAIELQQNTNNNNICSDKKEDKRLDNENNNTLIISTSTNSIKKKHVYKRKKPCIFEGCTSLRRGGTKYCVRHGGKKYRSCCRDILAVAIVLHTEKRTMSKTPHTIYKGMLLDIYSQHQVNCTCQSGHALNVHYPCVEQP